VCTFALCCLGRIYIGVHCESRPGVELGWSIESAKTCACVVGIHSIKIVVVDKQCLVALPSSDVMRCDALDKYRAKPLREGHGARRRLTSSGPRTGEMCKHAGGLREMRWLLENRTVFGENEWLGRLGGWRGEGFGRVYGRGAGSFQLDGWGEGGVGGEDDDLSAWGAKGSLAWISTLYVAQDADARI